MRSHRRGPTDHRHADRHRHRPERRRRARRHDSRRSTSAPGRTFEAVSTSTGVYSLQLLPVGDYEVTFTLTGFQPLTVKGITLASTTGGSERQADGQRRGRGRRGDGGAQLVQPTPALQSLVDSKQVQELPLNNRNFVQLATLAPGVSSDLPDEVGIGLTSTVSISVNGARRNAVNWLVDGVSNVDVGSNITLLSTPDAGVDRGVQDHHQQLRGGVAPQRRRRRERRDQVGHRRSSAAAPTTSAATTA